MNDLTQQDAMEYLRCAAELEKQHYIWAEAMQKENAFIRDLMAQKSDAYQRRTAAELKLRSFNDEHTAWERKIDENREYCQERLDEFQGKIKKYKILKLASIIISVILGVVVLISFLINGEDFVEENALLFALVILIEPLTIWLSYKFAGNQWEEKQIYDKIKKKKDELDIVDKTERKLDEYSKLKDEIDEQTARYNRICNNEAESRKRQDIISKNLIEIKSVKEKLYALNIIDPRYRKFQAVFTLYDYFRKGQCTTLYGHGGAIDTYEEDLRWERVISLLWDIKQIVRDISDKQSELCNEARRANATLEQIERNTSKMIECTQDTNKSLREANETLYRTENNIRFK